MKMFVKCVDVNRIGPSFFTKGKIYEWNDGIMYDDDGDTRNLSCQGTDPSKWKLCTDYGYRFEVVKDPVLPAKFQTVEALAKAYESLEKEYTRKCQELKRLKGEKSDCAEMSVHDRMFTLFKLYDSAHYFSVVNTETHRIWSVTAGEIVNYLESIDKKINELEDKAAITAGELVEQRRESFEHGYDRALLDVMANIQETINKRRD